MKYQTGQDEKITIHYYHINFSKSLSNAVGALGADFSAISINPAGIGVYRNSIFHLGFDVPFYTVESRLSNGESNNRNFKTTDASFNFANTVGAVFSIEQHNSPWKFVNIGIGLNKTADYNQSFYFSGKSQGSITDRFLELALDPNGNYPAGINPNNLDNFEAGLAYETGAIFDPNLNDNKTEYTTDFIKFKNYPVKKDQLVNERGKASDLYFMVGGNYNDKLKTHCLQTLPESRVVLVLFTNLMNIGEGVLVIVLLHIYGCAMNFTQV